MHNKGMVEGFPECDLEVDFCEHCIYGKQSRVCYPRYLGITRRSCLEAHMVLDMEYREQG
jgi:hypothetical protein